MQPTIAYFSAEYSVADSLPIYAGGLGILAGDTIMEAGVQDRPFFALGLVYHKGFRGGDSDPRPMTERLGKEGFTVLADKNGQPVQIPAPVADRVVVVQVWHKVVGKAELMLLDAGIEANPEADRSITDQLYDDDLNTRIAQQMVLGFGGVELLRQLGITPDTYHLNEGHMAFAGLAVAARYQSEHPEISLNDAINAVRPKLVATKHTILPGAGTTLSNEQVALYLNPVLASHKGSVEDVMTLGGMKDGSFSTTKLVLSLAGKHSGVSKLHAETEAKVHNDSHLIPITNGIHAPRWRAKTWPKPPLELSDAELWHLHNHNRQQLLVHVAALTGIELDPDVLTVVWARRMTAYKRPDLLVSDMKRLTAIVNHPERPAQFIVAGHANPADNVGIDLMNRVIEASQNPVLSKKLAYLPEYTPANARSLVQGADLWLNTPVRGQEACGTSGMKASLNGALQFSTSDGWVDEVDLGAIGWKLAEEDSTGSLYGTLENDIVPLFYDRKDTLPLGWISKMRANIKLIESQFTADRMLNEYYEKLYK